MFTWCDRAGNIADTVTIEDVLYDFTLPEIAIDYPTDKIITNTKVLSYSLSEDFYEASFSWNWNSGVEDISAPYVVELTEDEKKKLKGNVGSAPNPAKTAYQIGSTLIKGGKYIYNKLTS